MKKKYLLYTFAILILASCSNINLRNYPEVNFVVSNGFFGKVYLIHDEKNGVIPEVKNKRKQIIINDKGYVFLRNYTDVILKDTWIFVHNQKGDELFITMSGMESGSDKKTVVAFIVAKTQEDLQFLFSNQTHLGPTAELTKIGVDLSIE